MGRLSTYISKGVHTVSGPFHPFSGAVDIIVVQQPDGSYKSSPWYVRFGKFQGVLKSKEKVVNICVDGVEAEFHMHLNHKGEAFFLKNADEEESAHLSPSSSGEDADRQLRPTASLPSKLRSCSYDYDSTKPNNGCCEKEALVRPNSRRARLLASVFGRRMSTKDDVITADEAKSLNGVIRMDSLERAEMAANLLDLKWSTTLVSSRRLKRDGSHIPPIESPKDEALKDSKVVVCSSDAMDLISDSVHRETAVETIVAESLHCASERIVAESYSRSISVHPLDDSSEVVESVSVVGISSSSISTCVPEETQTILAFESFYESQVSKSNVFDSYLKASSITEEERVLFGDLEDPCSNDTERFGSIKEDESSVFSGSILNQPIINNHYLDTANIQKSRLRNVSSDGCIGKTDHIQSTEMGKSMASSHSSNNFSASDLSDSSLSSSPETKPSSLRGSRRSWLFSLRKSRAAKVSHCDKNVTSDLKTMERSQSSCVFEEAKDLIANKMKVKTLMPTSEQLASLNLKEGKNTVVFTFSTSMLGKQQVDARIFLWKSNTRIVISDVDGTITRSDLLGQVMPLVGMDWSQTGVAHLFSAIKENGYEVLFLSARSISQSFVTRQFLFNIKQDGKALPEGPVMISPDGLFPSLFREVVRRAPHEFKIACLEDIKALFPTDTNPFYAGFGNRDTDEFSYLKVGVPRGKIFIINPKGDIVVNRRVSKKSYSSLHTLVHGMFPSKPSSEQEDFNSWNYWKIPPPILDI